MATVIHDIAHHFLNELIVQTSYRQAPPLAATQHTENIMIDTGKLYFHLTHTVLDHLEHPVLLHRRGIAIYGNTFYLPHPFGYPRLTVKFNVVQREINLETSLPKLLQGHNVFGSNDLHFLCIEVVKFIYRSLGLAFTGSERRSIESHRIRLGRLDTTCSFIMPTAEAVNAILEECCEQFRSNGRVWSAHGRNDYETLYNQKESQRVSDKFYCKFAELLVRRHRIRDSVAFKNEIMSLATNLLRYEVTWRSKELSRLGLNYADLWDRAMVKGMMAKRLEQLDFQGSIKVQLTRHEIDTLKLNRRDTALYGMWRQGTNLRVHRNYSVVHKARESLREHGVDIFRQLGSASEYSLKEMLTAENAFLKSLNVHRIDSHCRSMGWAAELPGRRGIVRNVAGADLVGPITTGSQHHIDRGAVSWSSDCWLSWTEISHRRGAVAVLGPIWREHSWWGVRRLAFAQNTLLRLLATGPLVGTICHCGICLG